MRLDPASEYLQWLKNRKPARINLMASAVLPCRLADLDFDVNEHIEINGPPDHDYGALQDSIGAHCGVSTECVVTASGTSMANFIAMAALIDRGDEVAIEEPVYEPLLAAAKYFEATIRRFPRDGHPAEFITKNTRLVIITNLHNPTCLGLDERVLSELADRARWAGARILIDEVYLECMYEKMRTAFHRGAEFVSTSSLTKAYGLSGLRCGWILAEPELAQRILRIKDLVDPSVPHVAESFSVMAFRKLEGLARRAKQIVKTNRALLREFLEQCDAVDLTVPEYGTCVFPRLKKGSVDNLCDVLRREYDTEVVPGRFFERPDHFRLGIGVDSAVLEEGLQHLQQAVEKVVS